VSFPASAPLFAKIADGDYLAPPGLPPLQLSWRDLSAPVFAMVPLTSAAGDTPDGCLLLHGSHSAPVERWSAARTAIRHFSLALERLYRIEDLRRTGWRNDEALMAMNEMGALMGTLDLQILLTKILELALRLCGAEVGSLVLRRPEGGFESRIEWGLSERDACTVRLRSGATLIEAAMDSGEAEYIPDVYLDDRLDTGADPLPVDSFVVLPLTTPNGTLGAINIVNVSGESGFNEARLSTMKTISSLAAIAVENARYHQEALENEKLKEQARIAETIQRGFFPRRTPDVDGIEVAGRTAPAQFVGGDYYDFVDLGDGRIGIAVADVSGHGISSGLVMTMTRTLFRAEASTGTGPGLLLGELNAHLAAEDLNGAFVTFMYAVLDTRSMIVRLASAGHTPLVHYTARNDTFASIGPEGLPLGLFEDVAYPEVEFSAGPGDLLLFLTDGLVESMNRNRVPFGDGRVEDVVRRLRDRPAAKILDELHSAVQGFTAPGAPHDDLTTVLVRLHARH